MPYETKNVVTNCCMLVDEQINQLERHQLRSNSLHRARIQSRRTILAAQRIISYAKELQIPVEQYILAAIDVADRTCRTYLTISVIANPDVRKQITQTNRLQVHLQRTARSDITHGKLQAEAKRTKSILISIHVVMEHWYEAPVGTIVALLIGLRTILNPVLLYAVPQIRELVDHDALQLSSLPRTVLRQRLAWMLEATSIVDTPEWRWWQSHIPTKSTRKRRKINEVE